MTTSSRASTAFSDLGWLRDEVAELRASDVGRPEIDPETALRLMLAGFLFGIVHDRRLVREARVNLAIRRFAGHGLHATVRRTIPRSLASSSDGALTGSAGSPPSLRQRGRSVACATDSRKKGK